MADHRVRLEHAEEPIERVVRSSGELLEFLQVGFDATIVLGYQDRLDVREVLVQRRPPDAGLLGDLRHRHRAQAVRCNESGRGLEDGVPYLNTVLLDRFTPQLRHRESVHAGASRYSLVVIDTMSRKLQSSSR